MARNTRSQAAAERVDNRPTTRSQTATAAPPRTTRISAKPAQEIAPAVPPALRRSTRKVQAKLAAPAIPSPLLKSSKGTRGKDTRKPANAVLGDGSTSKVYVGLPASSLPGELLTEIAEYLVLTYSLGSLASFNASCCHVYRSTLPSLYQSLILVTREKESYKELDIALPMSEDEPVPEGWKHVRFLHIRRPTYGILAKRIPDLYRRWREQPLKDDWNPVEDLPYLQDVFPKLSVLFLRRPYHCRWDRDPDEEGHVETQVQAIIYTPIKLSTVVSAAVLGIDRRHTQFATNDIGFARNLTGLDYWSEGHYVAAGHDTPKGARLMDKVGMITFARSGRFLPEPPQKYSVRYRFYEWNLVVHFNQEDDWTGTQARDTIQAILSLAASRPEKNVDDFWIPRLTVKGNKIPLRSFLNELSSQMPLRTAIRMNAKNEIYPFQEIAREVSAYAARLRTRWNDLGIPSNDMSVTLFEAQVGHGETLLSAKLDVCWQAPQRERRERHMEEQGLLCYTDVDFSEMKDAVFHQAFPEARVVKLPALRYRDM